MRSLFNFQVSRLKSRIFGWYFNVINSIAFWPAIISVFYLALVFIMTSFDRTQLAEELKSNAEWIKLEDAETASSILSTLIGSMITLMALSFSMVMIVLTQAMNSFSPKVMLGLITEKPHQVVLGNQLGAIVYFLVLLVALPTYDSAVPVFSVAMAVIIAILALVLFVYFIHNISVSVQITNVIKRIHAATIKQMEKREKEAEKHPDPDQDTSISLPYAYPARQSGFLQDTDEKELAAFACRNNMMIKLHGYVGNYFVKGRPLFHSDVSPEQLGDKVAASIYNYIRFYPGESIRSNYIYGFTQLSEIAVKSLSPGINDPGIASLCIKYLTDLFCVRYRLNEKAIFCDKQGSPRLILKNISFKELLNTCVTPIRQYGKNDILIARSLLGMLHIIGEQDAENEELKEVLNQQANAVLALIKDNLTTNNDGHAIDSVLDEMRKVGSNYFTFS